MACVLCNFYTYFTITKMDSRFLLKYMECQHLHSMWSGQNMPFIFHSGRLCLCLGILINVHLTKISSCYCWGNLSSPGEKFWNMSQCNTIWSFIIGRHFLMDHCSESCEWTVPVEMQRILLSELFDTVASEILCDIGATVCHAQCDSWATRSVWSKGPLLKWL